MWLKYHNQPISLAGLHDRKQSKLVSCYEKPQGFWITDDSEDCWRSWCVGEGFMLDRLTHKHEITLDESNILFIRNLLELCRFNDEFTTGEQGRFNRGIDWHTVAERYSGIIITPYHWEVRLKRGFMWYYTWDCASGCIWKVDAIRDIRLIEVVELETLRKESA